MANIVVSSPNRIQVTTSLTPERPVTLKNDTTTISSQTSELLRLDALNDVDPSGEANNATLVYDESTDKYIVKQIDLDGGTF